MNKTNKGFTLVELIVVITILAILGTIAFISLQGYSKTARDSRRTSDIGNIKTSLEMFILNTGKYPLPDVVGDGKTSYSGETVWTQGTIGNNVTTNLSKNLQKKPLDPLLDIEYTYSVTSFQKEYELMALYEGELSRTNDLINTSYAADAHNIKVEGTYNGIFVKTENYIIPVPSIITSETLPMNLEDGTNIDSMVITNGTNMPNVGVSGITPKTGELTFQLLATGTIDKNSSNGEKISVINAIQGAYSGTIFATESNYKNILDKTSDEDKLGLVNTIVLKEVATLVTTNGTSGTNGVCGADNGGSFMSTPTNLCSIGNFSYMSDGGAGNNYTWGCDSPDGGTSVICSAIHDSVDYPGCDSPDITRGGIIISACNLGTNISGTGVTSYGHYFQFGRNSSHEDGTWTNGSALIDWDWQSTGWVDGIDDGSANYWGVEDSEKTTATYVNQNSADKLKMKGPCANNYHVPTTKEWVDLYTAGLWGNDGTAMMNDLKLPIAGHLDNTNGNLIEYGISGYGDYWSSSPYSDVNFTGMGYVIDFSTSDIIDSTFAGRSNGFPIRCFRN